MISDDIPAETLAADDDLVGPYFLWRLLIDQRFQGRGYGPATLDAIVDYVRSRPNGATPPRQRRPPGEGSPQPFYLRYGFAEDRRGQVGGRGPPAARPRDGGRRIERGPSLSGHPPIIPRGNRFRRRAPGIEGRESGLSGNPDIPDPPNEGPTDLRGRLTRAREAVRALIGTLPARPRPRLVGERILTSGSPSRRSSPGSCPRSRPYIAKLLIDAVVRAITANVTGVPPRRRPWPAHPRSDRGRRPARRGPVPGLRRSRRSSGPSGTSASSSSRSGSRTRSSSRSWITPRSSTSPSSRIRPRTTCSGGHSRGPAAGRCSWSAACSA